MGPALLAEYEAVLGREALFLNSRITPNERSELLDIFLSLCEWTQIYFLWRPNLADESDNHLLELAVAGGADAVVTRNVRDLQNKQLLFSALRLLTPEEFLKEL